MSRQEGAAPHQPRRCGSATCPPCVIRFLSETRFTSLRPDEALRTVRPGQRWRTVSAVRRPGPACRRWRLPSLPAQKCGVSSLRLLPVTAKQETSSVCGRDRRFPVASSRASVCCGAAPAQLHLPACDSASLGCLTLTSVTARDCVTCSWLVVSRFQTAVVFRGPVPFLFPLHIMSAITCFISSVSVFLFTLLLNEMIFKYKASMVF